MQSMRAVLPRDTVPTGAMHLRAPGLSRSVSGAAQARPQVPLRYRRQSARLQRRPADKLRDAARIIIGAGAGCDARFNGEPADRAFYRKIEQWDREHAAEIAAARKIWGIE